MDAEQSDDLAARIVAYELLLDSIATERTYYMGTRREDPPEVYVYGDIIARGAARLREYQRQQRRGGT